MNVAGKAQRPAPDARAEAAAPGRAARPQAPAPERLRPSQVPADGSGDVVGRALARSGFPLPAGVRADLGGALAEDPSPRGRDDPRPLPVGGRLVGRPDSPAERRAAEAAERAGGPPAGADGAQLDSVRLHDDRAAGRAARSLGARAFSLGDDVFFAPGQYRPWSADGRKLIAHELAHVLQGRGAEPVIMRQHEGEIDRKSQEYLRGYNDGRANNDSAPGPLSDKGLADYDAGYSAGHAESAQAQKSLPPVASVPDVMPAGDAPLPLSARLQIIEEAGPAVQARLEQIIRSGGPLPDTKNGAKVIGAAIVDVEGYTGPTELRSINGADTDALGLGAPVYHATSPSERTLTLTQGRVTAKGGREASILGPRNESIFPHINDAEIKLFEDIIDRLPPDAKGRIYFTTWRIPKGGTADDLQPYPACSGCIRASFETAGYESGVDLVSHAPTYPPLSSDPFQAGTTPEQETPAATKTTGGGPAAEEPPTTTGPTPKVGGVPQAAIEVGAGIATVGLGWLAAYLKAKVDQKVARRQIEAFLQVAKQKINANPDEALKTMMVDPYATVYAWVFLSSSVITSMGVDPLSGDPSPSDSSPMIDLSSILYATSPVDPSLFDGYPQISFAGRHMTTTSTIVIDIPLVTPPLEELIADAKARNLPLDDLRKFALGRLNYAISQSEGAVQAEQAGLSAQQTGSQVFEQLDAEFKQAAKRKDVDLQLSISKAMVDVAHGLEKTEALLKTDRELVQKADEKVAYWQRILKLIGPIGP